MSEIMNITVHKMGRCRVLVSLDNGLWHLSISTPNASPSYEEIKEARYKYIPDDVTMAQIFPPSKEFVNVHPYCHHLWQIRNEDLYEYKGEDEQKPQKSENDFIRITRSSVIIYARCAQRLGLKDGDVFLGKKLHDLNGKGNLYASTWGLSIAPGDYSPGDIFKLKSSQAL